jgi:Cu/Zn superoxide dismutase
MFTYDEALQRVDDLMADAHFEREQAMEHGPNTTAGNSGIPCLTLAAQYTAEAQVWATVAQAITTRGREALEAGV